MEKLATLKSRVTLIAIPKTIMPGVIGMVETAAGRSRVRVKDDLDGTSVQQKKSCLEAPARARIRNTSQMKSARRIVTLPNGLAMAIAMTRITRVDAIGMAGIAAAKTGISNSAHTVCAEIRSLRSSEYG